MDYLLFAKKIEMRKTFLLFIVIFGICLFCCQNSSDYLIKYDDIDSICIDCWRWDKGIKYQIVSDKHKGYISKCIIDDITDSVIFPVEISSDDVDSINKYVTKVYLNNHSISPHIKKQTERLLYGMPKRMVTTIWGGGHCISDTFHLPTIRDFEYEQSEDFHKLYNIIISITSVF